eukprot:751212-Prymnesium_polylepis.1
MFWQLEYSTETELGSRHVRQAQAWVRLLPGIESASMFASSSRVAWHSPGTASWPTGTSFSPGLDE